MKKIFVSIGLAAAGAAGLPSAFAQGMEAGAAPKIWNVAANLRGFYDDNYTVVQNKTGSFGFELTPSISANIALQQTDIGVKYTFGMYYYLQRAENGITPLDYTHQGDIWIDHAFNERFKVTVADTLVVAQDPKLVDGGSVTRVSGNNVANHATLTLNSEWTRQFSTATHYGNNLIVYQGGNVSTNNTPPGQSPSNAALLNRMEQNFGTDFQWHFQPETVGFIGYNFSWVHYTGNAQISTPYPNPPSGPPIPYYSDARDTRTHYGYVGLSKTFSPNLSGSIRVGVSDTDVFNDPVSSQTTLAPYADVNATYTYMPGCYVQAGFTQDQNATDVVAPSANGQLTQYQESSTFYATWNHQLTTKLSSSVVSQYQYSSYKDGAYSGSTGDSTVSAGLHLNYQFDRHFSANAGYDFSELFSTINSRGNSRNVVYLGLGANY
jgi:hypothetical protein